MSKRIDMIEVVTLGVLMIAAVTFAFFVIKDPEATFGLLGQIIK